MCFVLRQPALPIVLRHFQSGLCKGHVATDSTGVFSFDAGEESSARSHRLQCNLPQMAGAEKY